MSQLHVFWTINFPWRVSNSFCQFGVSCAAEPQPAPQAKPAWAGGVFENPGVYSQIIKGQRYEWIPTEDVNFVIQPDGRVKIVAPPTKKSFDGANDCQRFLYDHTHKRLNPAEEAALFGDGLLLPAGNYGFAILWENAKSYDEVFNRPWDLTSNPETYRANSTDVDYVYLSVVPRVVPTTALAPTKEQDSMN